MLTGKFSLIISDNIAIRIANFIIYSLANGEIVLEVKLTVLLDMELGILEKSPKIIVLYS